MGKNIFVIYMVVSLAKGLRVILLEHGFNAGVQSRFLNLPFSQDGRDTSRR